MNSNDMSGGPAPAKAERRIVIVDDEEIILDLMETFVRDWSKEATILRYQNRDEAWRGILRRDPDLLITDMRNGNVPGRSGAYGMSGFELLKLLADRLVKYPVLAASGSFEKSECEALAKQCAGPHLNVSYLTKPFTKELFLQTLRKCLGPGDNHFGP